MAGIAHFLIGAVSVLLIVLGFIGFAVSGMFASVPGVPDWAFSIMPLLSIAFGILGFWSLVKKNVTAQYAFSILLLLGWSAGTILGVIIIILLSMSNNKEA